ncbi:tetratricopeptide repeat protein [Clostridioides difficile]|nr:tetratricopeptide repeat protein [Clostridioides difficile]
MYFEEKDYENAIKYYEDAIAVGCKSSLENLGDLYYQNQDIEKAISYYSRIPNNVSCQIKLGNIYEDLNNIEEAISWYKKASENGDTRSSYRLGCIYESLGNTKMLESILKWQVAKTI